MSENSINLIKSIQFQARTLAIFQLFRFPDDYTNKIDGLEVIAGHCPYTIILTFLSIKGFTLAIDIL